jgi:hypothetical protein
VHQGPHRAVAASPLKILEVADEDAELFGELLLRQLALATKLSQSTPEVIEHAGRRLLHEADDRPCGAASNTGP